MLSSRRRVITLTSAGVVLLALGARGPLQQRQVQKRAAAYQPPTTLDVEISGCTAIIEGPRCEVPAGGELRLFVGAAAERELAVSFDGRPSEFETTTWPDGRTLRVVVPASAETVRVLRKTDTGSAVWQMSLAKVHVVPEPVLRARELRAAGKLEEAAAALDDAVLADESDRAVVVALRARVDYARGRIPDAVAHFREAVALHRAVGRSSDAAEDAASLIFLLLERGRFGEVRPLLGDIEALSFDFPEGRALLSYYEGFLAADTGDLRLALRLVREAKRHAERLGADRLRRGPALVLARLLLDVGRTKDALDEFRTLLDSDGEKMSPCERGDLEDNVGWSAARLEAEGEAPALDPRGPLGEAIRRFRAACPDPNRIANALENLSFAELERGRVAEADAALAAAKRAESDPTVPMILFSLHLEGEIALASGRTDGALVAFGREQEAAAALGGGEDQRLAAEDRATALAAASRQTEAIAVLASADAMLDSAGAFIPLGEGKALFFGTRARADALLVSLLVEQRRPAEAMDAARRARLRLFKGLRGRAALETMADGDRGRWEDAFERYRAAREALDRDAAHDWELSASHLAAAVARRRGAALLARSTLDDALALLSKTVPLPLASGEARPHPLRAGELELLFFPTSSGWFGFARDESGVQATGLGRVVADSPPDVLAARLLRPFESALAKATRIRVLPHERARAIDFHALPWHGAPLVAHATVEYGLGLDAATPRPLERGRALVVADPGRDLSMARSEVEAVTRSLSPADGWNPVILQGRDARGDVVRTSLSASALFHYAGHAEFGGLDGAESALRLAEGGALLPADILSLPHLPSLVALFGCETGRESASGRVETLGLSNAFLSAGAATVIATSRVVSDTVAREVAAALYSSLAADAQLDASRALREAQLAVAKTQPTEEWAAFRALVR